VLCWGLGIRIVTQEKLLADGGDGGRLLVCGFWKFDRQLWPFFHESHELPLVLVVFCFHFCRFCRFCCRFFEIIAFFFFFDLNPFGCPTRQASLRFWPSIVGGLSWELNRRQKQVVVITATLGCGIMSVCVYFWPRKRRPLVSS